MCVCMRDEERRSEREWEDIQRQMIEENYASNQESRKEANGK